MTADDMLKTALDELDRLISADTIMGTAIDAGDKTIIPVASFGFGFGAGEGTAPEGGGYGSGAGGGVSPVAVIVIHKDRPGAEGVQVLSLKKSNPISEVIATVGEAVLPQVVEAIKDATNKEPEKEAKKENPVSDAPLPAKKK